MWMGIGMKKMNVDKCALPPGFRFHPTDEELISYYLASKVYNLKAAVTIAEVDLNRCEPWELGERGKMGDSEWYLFSLRDRKYPTGLRTNRATNAGYWKATGKDRPVFDSISNSLIGMKKTLVFYKGRAPRGHKTKWVMHEYRFINGSSQSSSSAASHHRVQQEEWVMCRIYHKNGTTTTTNNNNDTIISNNTNNPPICATTSFPTFQPHQPSTDYFSIIDMDIVSSLPLPSIWPTTTMPF